ncbi:MAG: gamma-glutamylcyclotransferase [Nitrospinae bacterium]|nr:gamma-glutamylcyclotransferase [Nitrospinota bacterium]
MVDAVQFFAYDQLINEEIFKEHGLEYVSKTSVSLSGWKRVFNKIPKDNEGQEGLGHANIEPTSDTSGMMHGELYEMDEKFIPKLDEIYGHPDEYQRKVMRFNRHDFLMISGFTYIAKLERTAKGLKPNKAMMKVFRRTKKLFPMLYFSRLMGTPTID